jgi:nucleoside-diphosphate-sugar epimerase
MLAGVAADYRYPATLVEQIPRRCRVVVGDVTQPLCGVQGIPSGVTHFWHSAASLRYENRYADEIFSTNTNGAANALGLATRMGASCFAYVSTAYVAGTRRGTIREEPVLNAETNNLYEQSKVHAETLLLSQSEIPVLVFRPSIVIGHSRTRVAINFSGMYGFFRKVFQFKRIMNRAQEGFGERQQVRIKLDPNVPSNLIPVDIAADEAVRICLSGAPPAIYHLTHPAPPRTGDVVRLMFSEVGMRPPLYTDTAADFTWLDSKFNERIDFYSSYIVGEKVFDRSNTEQALQGRGPDIEPLTMDRLRGHFQWYLPKLVQERAGLPASR